VQVAPDLPPRAAAAEPFTPRWVRVTLVIGAAIGVVWAAFLSQFLNEPSAVGRSKVVLVIWSLISLATAILALSTTILLRRHERSGRPLAWVVSILFMATCVGAIAGIPALIGLWSSRHAARP
jgi:cytochrome bd-type quinol oxidase subunit 2